MSVGRIEMVDGVKKYVRYATLGGSSGVPVGDVKNLSLKEETDSLTLNWQDPENVMFNGQTTAEWAGTKVIKKAGGIPTSESDGTLVSDSTVRNQYAVDGLQDTDVLEDTQYNYALFPYTTKNVYTMSDLNRVSGTKRNIYDPVLQNNTWADIDKASKEGVAKDFWNIGDEKDGYTIIGFDHDDLSNGSGKAGITFFLMDVEKTVNAMYSSNLNFVNYANSEAQITLQNLYDELSEELKSRIKSVDIKYQTTNVLNGAQAVISQKLFLLSPYEAVGSPTNASPQGSMYEYTGNYPISCWSRSSSNAYDHWDFYNRNSDRVRRNTVGNMRFCYAFCI